MDHKTYDFLFKLLLIGDSGVGKTSLMLSYVDGYFTNAYISTIGIDFKIKTLEIEGKKIKVQIWDTAGQERFHTITTAYYRSSHGVMLLYDISDRKSFNNVSRWIDNVSRFADSNVEIMIIGNKIDLENKRAVPTHEGHDIAAKYKVKFVETSAKYKEEVENIFNELIKKIYFGRDCAVSDSNVITNLDSSGNPKSGICCK